MRLVRLWLVAAILAVAACAVAGIWAVALARAAAGRSVCEAAAFLPLPVVNCNAAGWIAVGVVWMLAAILLLAGLKLARALGSCGSAAPAALLAVQAIVLACLTFFPLSMSVDPYLYVTYGRLLGLHGINPYSMSGPIAAGSDAVLHACFAAVFNPPSADPYGRLFTLLTAGIASVEQGLPLLAQVWTYRVLAAVSAVAMTAGMLRMLRRTAEPAEASKRVALVALNPLMLFEAAVGGHNDFLMMAAAIWSFALVDELPLIAGLLLGIAISVKFVAVIALPFFAIYAARTNRGSVASAAVASAVALAVGALSLPLLWTARATASTLATHVATFGMSPTWLLLRALSADASVTTAIQLAAGAALAAIAVIALVQFARAMLFAPLWRTVTAAIWALPLVHPWYGAWLVPAASGRGRWAAFAWWTGVFFFLRYPLEGVAAGSYPIALRYALTVLMFGAPLILAVTGVAPVPEERSSGPSRDMPIPHQTVSSHPGDSL